MIAEALVVAYVAVVAAGLAVEVTARREGSGAATLDAAVARLLVVPGVRWIVLTGWVWLGWHLFARSSR